MVPSALVQSSFAMLPLGRPFSADINSKLRSIVGEAAAMSVHITEHKPLRPPLYVLYRHNSPHTHGRSRSRRNPNGAGANTWNG